MFPIRGYSITMPEFDLSQPFEGEYRLASLPDIGKECGVYLAIPDRQWSGETKQVGGQLRFELLDSQGHAVIDVSGRLGEFWWATSGRRSELYQLDKSFFTPRSGEEYRLRVFYTPDPSLAGHKGFVYLRSGGAFNRRMTRRWSGPRRRYIHLRSSVVTTKDVIRRPELPTYEERLRERVG